MERSVKLEYPDLSRTIRDVLPENDNETSIHQSYIVERTVYPDQCWEIDSDRTMLTQYIARHPFSIRSTFTEHDRLLIDGKLYSVTDVRHGHFEVTSWTATVIWYYLRAHNALESGPPPAGKWHVMPGKFVDPKPIPMITCGALFSYKVRPAAESVDIDLMNDVLESRHRYDLVVNELNRVRFELEQKKKGGVAHESR